MKILVFKDNHFCKSFGITSQTKIVIIYKSLIEQAQNTAAQLGLTEEEINAEIKTMRAEKRK